MNNSHDMHEIGRGFQEFLYALISPTSFAQAIVEKERFNSAMLLSAYKNHLKCIINLGDDSILDLVAEYALDTPVDSNTKCEIVNYMKVDGKLRHTK